MPSPAPDLSAFFHPRRVAVIGASRDATAVGGAIFANIRACGFRGEVVPVNPRAGTVQGCRAYAAVGDVPGPVDLAIIAVPAAAVERAVGDCVAAGVRAVVVISAGFGETGAAGREVERRLRDTVRGAGMRMIGPNCLGLVNADPAVSLNASFAPDFPPPGAIAFSSQSGALGLAILEYARRLDLGLSMFVSVGNKADISTNDLIEYWEADPATRVILLYVESFGNPRRFGQIARRVGRQKPIVAVKAGRSRAGARAATSHTGAMAASDTFVEALFDDAGVIRTDTIEELFDAATLLAHQPLPAGPRVGILTNAGGPGIIAADACDARGLTVPPLQAATVAALRQFLAPQASAGNPVDTVATAPPDHFRLAIPLLLADPGIDALLVIFIPLLGTSTRAVAEAVAAAAAGAPKPVLACFFGAADIRATLAPIPCYGFPESAVRALAHAVRHARWRSLPHGPAVVCADETRARLRACLSGPLEAGGGWLSMPAALALLREAGLRTVDTHLVRSADEAVRHFEAHGTAVVLKGSGAALQHKTEAHAVMTDLDSEEAVRRAFAALAANAQVDDILIQPMLDGVEMIVGATLDPVFGHAVMCGSGGTGVALRPDAAWRLAPLSADAAAALLDDVAGVAWLRGYRGAPLRDEASLRDAVLRVGALVEACPEIAELDANPVIVTADAAWVVDARIRVSPLGSPPPGRPAGC